jgi:hypothetical protein
VGLRLQRKEKKKRKTANMRRAECNFFRNCVHTCVCVLCIYACKFVRASVRACVPIDEHTTGTHHEYTNTTILEPCVEDKHARKHSTATNCVILLARIMSIPMLPCVKRDLLQCQKRPTSVKRHHEFTSPRCSFHRSTRPLFSPLTLGPCLPAAGDGGIGR